MPELPEVETIRRGLAPRLVGRTVKGFVFGDPKILKCDASELAERLTGSKVEALERRGKYLVFDLGRHYLIVHLGMSGRLTLRSLDGDSPLPRPPGASEPVAGLPDKHTHLAILFDNGYSLLFRDPRKFGRVVLLPHETERLVSYFSRLGVEPLSEDYRLEVFLKSLGRRIAPVKALLLDQRTVAGVGNIYADEALFEAGVHPARRARNLRRYEKVRLFEALPKVLEKGIRFGGTSLRDYVDSAGEAGSFQGELAVYGRDGEPCRRCGSVIRRIVVRGRGTHFCPTCQKR
jgi:formamidopyrimidine-DNA glycosylase